MTDSANGGWWRGEVNPFPPAPDASAPMLQLNAPTIATTAVEEMRRLIDKYVRANLPAEDADGTSDHPVETGLVIVVEGDYGTGKTHLALEALNRVESARKNGLDPRPYYQVAPGGSFQSLYFEIMRRQIGDDEILRRVLEFYSEIVAEELQGYPFADQLVGRLRRDEVDPRTVVEERGLREGALLAELRRKIGVITDNEEFGTALMLLLQPELRVMVWDWFTGGTPGQLLREQGLFRPIETEIQALEALGVIARLYGRRKGRRLVLIIDEMEKMALVWDRSDQANLQAFRKLLDIFRGAGVLFIICRLSNVVEIIPSDTRRVDAIINPSNLNFDNVYWYIRMTIEGNFGRKTAGPFTGDAIDYIVYLASGVARDVIRLCYHSYATAVVTGEVITREVVNSVALTGSRRGVPEVVRTEIQRSLFAQIEDLFGAAEESLAAYGDVRRFIDDTFEIAARGADVFSLTRRFRERDALTSIGVAMFLSDVLQGFRQSVLAWFGSLGNDRDPAQRLLPAERQSLRGICTAYEALYVVAPLFRLDSLLETTSQPGAEQELPSRADRIARREALRGSLDELSDRVYATALELAGEAADGEGPAGRDEELH
jgi:Cdc6-like AAA superfamily ATPase